MSSAHREQPASRWCAGVAFFCLVSALAAQESLQTPLEESAAQDQERLYAGAKPYLFDELPALQKEVPELRGLQPADTQSDLPTLLAKVGNAAEGLLSAMPNLICREQVRWVIPGTRFLDSDFRRFNYLIVIERSRSAMTMTEYRTDMRNRRIGEFGKDLQAPAARGFALAWMYFHPTRLSESQSRYLGTQKIDGRKSFVMAFSQVPGRVKFPGGVGSERRTSTLLYQGIAWIDATDFRIVRLRTDLLAPQPAARLLKLTTEVNFAEVRIPHGDSQLWLPRKATVEWRTTDAIALSVLESVPEAGLRYHAIEEHSYSNYHLYKVAVRINPSATEP
jgi:hypothetical protein